MTITAQIRNSDLFMCCFSRVIGRLTACHQVVSGIVGGGQYVLRIR